MSVSLTLSEADILADVIAPHDGDMAEEAARLVLKWKFSPRASAEMRRLLDANNKGQLSGEDAARLESYRRVGLLVDLVQAKARASLGAGGSE